MSKQFTIITKDDSKWLRPVLNPSDTDQLSRFFQNAGDGFEDLPYIGTRPEGTTGDESEVKEVVQYRQKDNENAYWKIWTTGVIDWDCVIETRTAYTDAESHNLPAFDEILNNTSDDAKMNVSLQMDLNYWKRRCEAAEGLLNAEAELEHNLITAEEYILVKEEWDKIVKEEVR